MMKYILISYVLIFGCKVLAEDVKPIEIAVITASYNNEKWAQKNLQSLAMQTYPHVHVYYIDDCSTDRTGKIVDEFVESNNLQDKFTVIHNKKRKGSLANFYSIIHTLKENVVVACVDGDDHLKIPQALEIVAQAYADKNVWMTYGSYTSYPKHKYPNICVSFPRHIVKDCNFRKHDWTASHLKTFYAKLFQKIKKKSLLMDGAFYDMGGDLAFMFPILEMASKGHIHFIDTPIYVYRVNNPLNDFRIDQSRLSNIEEHIRSRKQYKPLRYLFNKEKPSC
jgi:glycosyltransferase involved in cell wall biosynthesis